MKVTLIQGDGIGPEICSAIKQIFKAAGADVEWEELNAGLATFEATGKALPNEVLDSIVKNKVALKGPTTTPVGRGHNSINVRLRKELDLYANVRPIYSIPGVSKYENVSLLIVRENTEDLYSGLDFRINRDTAQSIKIITRGASERIARYACSIGLANEWSKITCVHKANIMKETDGLFLESCRDAFKRSAFSQKGTFEDLIVDNACMQLVMRPERFQIIVTENLYGDIISDLCAGLVGGLGVAAGANLGDDIAVYEAVHGSAPDIAGKGLANPTALLLSATMLLRENDQYEVSDRIEDSLFEALMSPETRTGDLGGKLGTQQFTDVIIKNLK